ncbi:STP1 protein [Plasmodium ovale]|uniref:STP1 protein n=1 Tax=Plasmodium ovale TaxID=36330 RepID=A0A1D3JCV8_PLAOA|nr:STP1 protein [Plasmodium ovale]
MHLKSIHPNYEYIEEYQEYFNIHHNYNYPWLVNSTADAKKDIPLSPLNSFKGELGPASNKYFSINPEIAHKKRGSPDNTNIVKDNVTPKIEDIGTTGTDISKYPSNSYTKPNYADIKRFPVATTGKKIPYVIRFPIHKAPDIFIVGRPVQVANDFRHQIFMYSHIKEEFYHWKNILEKLNFGELLLHSVIMNFFHSLEVLQISNYDLYSRFFNTFYNYCNTFFPFQKSPHFDSIDNHSTDDIPYENKIHNDKNIYNQIIIQKSVLKKNISVPQRKKNKRKTIIDIHIELFNECKNDEWELNKDDFLEICLEQFIKEQNKIYSNSENSNLITKLISIENAKEERVLLWDKWAEKYTPIWENFKRGNTFKILPYEWKEEENAYFDQIEEQNSSLNENEKTSYIEIKKDIWRRWITKQTKLIELYKEEQWFKSLVEELENVSDEYKKGKITDDIFVENIKELENKENSEELYKLNKHIFQIKVLIQILMMVIEECIKEENPEQTEVLLDKLINKLKKEKRAKVEPENIYEENMNHI